LYDVFVVADNCSDNTKGVAAENGSFVFERFDEIKMGACGDRGSGSGIQVSARDV